MKRRRAVWRRLRTQRWPSHRRGPMRERAMELPGWRSVPAARREVVALLCSAPSRGGRRGSREAARTRDQRLGRRRPRLTRPVRTSAAASRPSTGRRRPPPGRARERRADLAARAQDAGRVQVRPGLRAADPTEPDLVPGQIADVSIHKNAAYLASRAEPPCRRGGFFSVDISDPKNPKQLAFVPALPAPPTVRARTRSRSTRRPSRATCWRSTTSRAASAASAASTSTT